MDYRNYISAMGFTPKEHSAGIYTKKYPQHDGYYIDIDFDSQSINYHSIASDSKTTQNFSQPENFVVLECVDRLLTKGYKPKNIILEKTWSAGHGTSGRLDICVTHDDGSEYLLIECKTYGKEFEKELKRMDKDGGQLFTYFKFSNKADVIMLYCSALKGKEIVYKNSIVKIEDDYRTGDVKDFYEKWNKLTKDNGVFDSWVNPYTFESKALTLNELIEIKPEDSGFIFNRFLEILRHNVVSDKPNAFNKIFTLFLCKIYDEKVNEGSDNELRFQWLEGIDDDVSFQLRLTDLYKEGMDAFLEKKVTDFSEDEFEKKYKNLEAGFKADLLNDFKRLRLEKNNEFAIKEVYDDKSFRENAKVVKQVVELLQKYRIRYAKKQQYLSDFFEMLLTTGLKQESGQFFTPVPIAQFVIKSLPVDSIVTEKLKSGKRDELLPYIIDYAAGSGHFITESMHEVQRLLNKYELDSLRGDAKKFVETTRISHFDWAFRYVYGVEKDYRLVKVGKVGCYLHGDGLANVIHSDGLANFNHPDYKGKLKESDPVFKQENKQFDILVSNPPYSVSAFKNAAREYYTKDDFELYDRLTDSSSEIECLFIERTKQLLKDGGVSGIILPSSILSNAGIYTNAREIILQYFDIVGITELGSNTFMATGTNTVVLFLRRRNNYDSINLRRSAETFFETLNDVTLNGIENPVSKYIAHVWGAVSFDDYVTLLKKSPNKTIEHSDLYKEYKQKFKNKKEEQFWNDLLSIEKEKLYYFILTFPQKTVVVRSGSKDEEKRFLGYEFSNRRGSEGIHAIERNKTIDECTKLFDPKQFDNPEKASTYIYRAFNGDFDCEIAESMKKHVSRSRLVDMLTFDRADFEKTISTAAKKKVTIESKYPKASLESITSEIIRGVTYSKNDQVGELTSNVILTADNITLSGSINICKEIFLRNDFAIDQSKKLKKNDCFICFSSGSKQHIGKVAFIQEDINYFAGGFMGIIRANQNIIIPKFLFELLNYSQIRDAVRLESSGNNINNLSNSIKNLQLPLPPKEVQEKIVAEIEKIEKKVNDAKKLLIKIDDQIRLITDNCFSEYRTEILSNICYSVEYGSSAKSQKEGLIPVIRMGNIQNGKVDWNDLVYTSNKDEISKYKLQKNDILFNRTNSPELVGKVGIYKGERPAIFAGYLIRINYKPECILPVYLSYILNSKQIREYGYSVMSKSVNQANINGTLLKAYKIPLPSIEDQQKIVDKIEVLEKQMEDAQMIIDKAPEEKEAILKKYL